MLAGTLDNKFMQLLLECLLSCRPANVVMGIAPTAFEQLVSIAFSLSPGYEPKIITT